MSHTTIRHQVPAETGSNAVSSAATPMNTKLGAELRVHRRCRAAERIASGLGRDLVPDGGVAHHGDLPVLRNELSQPGAQAVAVGGDPRRPGGAPAHPAGGA